MSAEDLMARIEQARSGLQTSRNLLTDARGVHIPERIGYEKAQGVLESINRHTGDFLNGAIDVVEETVSDVLNTITNPLEALEDTVKGAIDAIENPREALDALTEPYREAWNEGRPGEAIGRGVVEVGSVFLGGTGAVRAAVRVARRDGGNDGADGDGDPNNDDDNNEADNENGSTGSSEVIQGEGFTVKESKFDYFFGRVTSSPHNEERSQQNLEDLRQLGIDEASGGRERLLQVFTEGQNAPEVGNRRITEYGVTITRRVEVTGGESPGAIDVKYFYPNGDLSATPEVSTIIPKIYR